MSGKIRLFIEAGKLAEEKECDTIEEVMDTIKRYMEGETLSVEVHAKQKGIKMEAATEY